MDTTRQCKNATTHLPPTIFVFYYLPGKSTVLLHDKIRSDPNRIGETRNLSRADDHTAIWKVASPIIIYSPVNGCIRQKTGHGHSEITLLTTTRTVASCSAQSMPTSIAQELSNPETSRTMHDCLPVPSSVSPFLLISVWCHQCWPSDASCMPRRPWIVHLPPSSVLFLHRPACAPPAVCLLLPS